jgi:hypothetical protein
MHHTRSVGLVAAVALAAAVHSAGAQAPDTAAAVSAIHDFAAACGRDHGALWGRTLCGPMLIADRETGFAVASERPPAGTFEARDGVFLGRIPEGMGLANTAFDWSGRRWSSVRMPLPADRFDRLALVAHEAFHRIQPAIGLAGADAMNPHLDERNGRYWLRLELHALSVALTSSGAAARIAARDAMLFRAQRQQLYPGADTLEPKLERAEGLAEYTGDKLALALTGAPVSRVADVREFESQPTFVRSLGYGTGPLLGLLLDRYAPGWRKRVARQGMAAQLAHALRFVPPPDLAAAAERRAPAYGAAEVGAQEDARNQDRQRRLADLRARLVTGPVLILEQNGLRRAFDPNTLMAMPPEGTVYPTGAFSAEWGSLDVTGGGALVASDYHTLRVPAPADTAGRTIHGEGWTLELAPGWSIRPGARPGDLTVGH